MERISKEDLIELLQEDGFLGDSQVKRIYPLVSDILSKDDFLKLWNDKGRSLTLILAWQLKDLKWCYDQMKIQLSGYRQSAHRLKWQFIWLLILSLLSLTLSLLSLIR